MIHADILATTKDDGQYIENWFLFNKDTKQFEVTLGGKLSAPGASLKGIVSAEQGDVARNYFGKTFIRSPFRKLWVDRGINWANTLKWYYDENRIFPIKAILKYKQVVCMRRKMPFTIFKYLFSFQRYLSF